MPSIYDLKPRFQALLRPITRGLARCGVTANQVTLLAAVLSVATGACITAWPTARWPLWLVPAMLFLRMALNAIDGMLAREHEMKTKLGAVLNELGDVISDTALYLPLAMVPGVRAALVIPAVLLAVISEMTGVVAVQIGAQRRYDGPMGKSDRAFVFGLICLLLGCGVPTGTWLDVCLGVILALLSLTIVNRARGAARGGWVMGNAGHVPAFQWTIAGIFALLIVATATIQVLQRIKPESNWTQMRQRVNSWWIMVVIFTIAMLVNRTVSLAFFAFVSFLALKEYFTIIPTRRADRRVLFWAYLVIPLQYFWVYQEWYGMFIIFIPVFIFLLLPLRMLIIGGTDGFLRASGTLQWGLMITVFSLSHAAFLLILRLKDAPDVLPGPGMVLYLVVLTQLNDVAQFAWGKSLGTRKIVPTISPGKTWAGFVGGVATTTGVAWLAGPQLTPLDASQSLGAGLIIGIGGFLGDINLSALKRDLHIKDSGTLLPGHGGILDRIDSLTYTAPLFFHYVYFLYDFHTFGTAGPAYLP